MALASTETASEVGIMGEFWPRYRGYVLLSLGWIILFGVTSIVTNRPPPGAIEIIPPPTPTVTPPPTATPTPGPLRVYVSGAVRAPDVYTLDPGAIIKDAIEAAGGALPAADLTAVNQALTLSDGVQVHVPQEGEALLPQAVIRDTASDVGSLDPSGPVDLNRATLEELQTLSGVGPVTAERIIEGRPYGSVEDLLRVRGIGPATLDKLRDQVVVE